MFAKQRLREKLRKAQEKRLNKDARLMIRAKAMDEAELSGLAPESAQSNPGTSEAGVDFEELATKTLHAVISRKKEEKKNLSARDIRLIQDGVRAAFAENPLKALDTYGLIGETYEHLRTGWRKTIDYFESESKAMGGDSSTLSEVQRQAKVEDALRNVQEELKRAAEEAKVSEEDALDTIADLEETLDV